MMRFSISDSFHNKTALHEGAYDKSFIAKTISVEQLISHIVAGRAWAVGIYENDHRKKEHFQTSWLLALDIDNDDPDKTITFDEIVQNAEIRSFAALVHPTPSSAPEKPKTRVLFILDRQIPDKEKWEKAQQAVMRHFRQFSPDPKCKDAARFYYGSDLNGAVKAPGNRLSLDKIAEWVKEYDTYMAAELEKTRHDAPYATYTPDNIKYAEKAYQNTLNELWAATEGKRNDLLNKAAYKLFGWAKAAWPGIDALRIERDLQNAGEGIGLSREETARTIASARNASSSTPLNLEFHRQYQPLADFDLQSHKEQAQSAQQSTLAVLQHDLRAFFQASRADELDADELRNVAEKINASVDTIMAMSGNLQVVSGTSAVKGAYQLIKERKENPCWVQGFASGIKDLDFALGGFPPGQFYAFLGATTTGKTTLAATLSLAFADKAPGLIISCETTPETFALRQAAYFCKIPHGHIARGGKINLNERTGKYAFEPLSDEQWRQVALAQSQTTKLMQSGTILWPGSAPTPAILRSLVRQHRDTIQWVILDSLNNVALPYYASEYERVTAAAHLCEQLAVDNNLTVVGTCQIGRSTKERANKEPTLYDARGSGHVEEKAAVIVGIYNHWSEVEKGHVKQGANDENDYPRNAIKMNILKLRDGETGRRFDVGYVGGCGFYRYDENGG